MKSSFNLVGQEWICTEALTATEMAKLAIFAQFAGLDGDYLKGYNQDSVEHKKWPYLGCHANGRLDRWTKALIEGDRKDYKCISLKELRAAIEIEINKSNK